MLRPPSLNSVRGPPSFGVTFWSYMGRPRHAIKTKHFEELMEHPEELPLSVREKLATDFSHGLDAILTSIDNETGIIPEPIVKATEEDFQQRLMGLADRLTRWIDLKFSRLSDKDKVALALGVINQTNQVIRSRKEKPRPTTITFNLPGVTHMPDKVVDAIARTVKE